MTPLPDEARAAVEQIMRLHFECADGCIETDRLRAAVERLVQDKYYWMDNQAQTQYRAEQAEAERYTAAKDLAVSLAQIDDIGKERDALRADAEAEANRIQIQEQWSFLSAQKITLLELIASAGDTDPIGKLSLGARVQEIDEEMAAIDAARAGKET